MHQVLDWKRFNKMRSSQTRIANKKPWKGKNLKPTIYTRLNPIMLSSVQNCPKTKLKLPVNFNFFDFREYLIAFTAVQCYPGFFREKLKAFKADYW